MSIGLWCVMRRREVRMLMVNDMLMCVCVCCYCWCLSIVVVVDPFSALAFRTWLLIFFNKGVIAL